MGLHYTCDICGNPFKKRNNIYSISLGRELKIVPGSYYASTDTFTPRDYCQKCLNQSIKDLSKKMEGLC